MINFDSIDRDWILKVSNVNKADPSLVEKVIFALCLLESLVKNKLDFVFKGGTALMLHHGSAKRLSIDIDILIENHPKNLEDTFKKIVGQDVFLGYSIKKRKAVGSIDKMHVKFFYQSLLHKKELPVLLDILFETSLYHNNILLDIASHFIPQKEEPLKVVVPSQEDLLGDKLTAFAPNTTGIPYQRSGTSMSMEIIKQLYDIGHLFDAVTNLEVVTKTFENTAKKQIEYRSLEDLSTHDVLKDIQDTALSLLSRGQLGHQDFNILQEGVKRVGAFIHSESYNIESAVVSAAKAMYVSTCIEAGQSTLEHLDDVMQMKDWQIKNQNFSTLNKLKKSSPETFYYVYQALKLKKLL